MRKYLDLFEIVLLGLLDISLCFIDPVVFFITVIIQGLMMNLLIPHKLFKTTHI